MAARYWVGGTDTWDNTAGTKWALTSGGAGGEPVPTAADTVFFNAASGANTVTIGITAEALTLTMTGFTGTLAFGTNKIQLSGNATTIFTGATTYSVTGTPLIESIYSGTTGTRTINTTTVTEANSISFNITAGGGTVALGASNRIRSLDFTGYTGTASNGSNTCTFFGNLTMSSGMTFTSGTSAWTFGATSGTQVITSAAGLALGSITQNNPGATLQLNGNVTLASTRTFTFTAGTLDLANNTLSVGLFSSTNSNVRTILFGTGNITVTGTGSAWSITTSTNLSYTGTPTVNISNSGAVATSISSVTGSANSFDFNITSGTYAFGTGSTFAVRSLNFTGFTGSWASSSNTGTFFGNLTLVSGMTYTTGTGLWTFSAPSGTQVITSAGKTLPPITQNVAGTTVQLSGALTVATAQTYTVQAGILDLNGFDLSCGRFVCSNTAAVRAIYFGTNQINVTGNNATVVNVSTTAFSFTGTYKIVSTYTGSTGTRTFIATGIEAAALTVGAGPANQISIGTTATDIVVIGGSPASLDFTGFTGTWSWNTLTLFGNLTVVSGMTVTPSDSVVTFSKTSGTQVITSAGQTLGGITHSGNVSTLRLASDITLSTTAGFILTFGTLDLNNYVLTTGKFTSNTPNIRSILFGTGNITVIGSGSLVLSLDDLSTFSYTGSGVINLSNNSATASSINFCTTGSTTANTPDLNITTGTYAITIQAGSKFRNLNFTGFAGSWSPGSNSHTIYRSVTLSSGMTYTAGTSIWTISPFGGVTSFITSAGKTLYSLSLSGGGATGNVTIVDPLILTDALTHFGGIFDANNQNVSVGSYISTSGSIRTLFMGSGTWTLTGTSSNIWNIVPSNLTFNKGTANINVTVALPSAIVTFVGGGLTYNNLTLTQPSVTGALSITGANTFDTITCTKTVPYKLFFASTVTNNVTTLVANGSSGNILAIASTSVVNAAGLNVTNSFTADYVAVTDVSLTNLNGVVTNGYLQYTTAPVFGWTLGTGSQYYRAFTTGTIWQVPAGFSSPNIVHILGAGGGGSGGSIASVTSTRAGGAGGGGGGYAQLVNQSYTAGSGIGYVIGSAGSAGSGATGGGTSTGGTGGTTSWGAIQNTITFVAAELSVQNTSSTSITVTVPAGVSNGDLMLMMVTSASSPSWTTPSGWTLGTSGSQGRAVFYRTASSEPANYVVTGSVSSTHDAYIVVYANATYDKQAGITSSSLSNPTTPSAITLATPNSTVLVVTKSTSGSVTFTTPTGYTVVSSDSDSTGPSTAVFSASISAAGTYTAPSSTLSSGSGYSYIVALSPTLGSYSTTASGGTGGVSAGGLTSTAGTGGTGSGGSTNYTGGTGGIGGNTTTVSVATGGGGGAGGAGPNGNGGNGGNGLANSLMAGGGGGGNGGGSAGANSTVANTGGNGGNNSLGVGGGTSSTSAFQGGGGVGGSGGGGGNGSAGDEIITVAGSGGGGGGSGSAGASAAAAGNYGAGGSGGSVSTTPTASSGGAGTQGLVLIIWTFTSGGFTANITENSSLADVLSILASYNVSQTEDSTLTENQNISAQFAASQTENSNLDDTTTQQANYIQSFTENVNIDDLKTVVAQFINSVTEAVTVDDIEQASLMFIDSISENLTAESIESIQATFVNLITENINAADLNSVKMDYLVAVFENAGLLDEAIGSGWFSINDGQISSWDNVNNTSGTTWNSINSDNLTDWNPINNSQ